MKPLEDYALTELRKLEADNEELLSRLKYDEVKLSTNEHLNEIASDSLFVSLTNYKDKIKDAILEKEYDTNFNEKDCDVFFIHEGQIRVGLLKDWQGDILEISMRGETIFKQKSECNRHLNHFINQLQFNLTDDYAYILEA